MYYNSMNNFLTFLGRRGIPEDTQMLAEGLVEGVHFQQGQVLVEEARNLQAFMPNSALCRCHL